MVFTRKRDKGLRGLYLQRFQMSILHMTMNHDVRQWCEVDEISQRWGNDTFETVETQTPAWIRYDIKKKWALKNRTVGGWQANAAIAVSERRTDWRGAPKGRACTICNMAAIHVMQEPNNGSTTKSTLTMLLIALCKLKYVLPYICEQNTMGQVRVVNLSWSGMGTNTFNSLWLHDYRKGK